MKLNRINNNQTHESLYYSDTWLRADGIKIREGMLCFSSLAEIINLTYFLQTLPPHEYNSWANFRHFKSMRHASSQDALKINNRSIEHAECSKDKKGGDVIIEVSNASVLIGRKNNASEHIESAVEFYLEYNSFNDSLACVANENGYVICCNQILKVSIYGVYNVTFNKFYSTQDDSIENVTSEKYNFDNKIPRIVHRNENPVADSNWKKHIAYSDYLPPASQQDIGPHFLESFPVSKIKFTNMAERRKFTIKDEDIPPISIGQGYSILGDNKSGAFDLWRHELRAQMSINFTQINQSPVPGGGFINNRSIRIDFYNESRGYYKNSNGVWVADYAEMDIIIKEMSTTPGGVDGTLLHSNGVWESFTGIDFFVNSPHQESGIATHFKRLHPWWCVSPVYVDAQNLFQLINFKVKFKAKFPNGANISIILKSTI